MKVSISDSIANLYRSIVEYYSDSEMQDYNALAIGAKEQILSETFERRFKSFWNSVTTNFKKDANQEEEESQEKKRKKLNKEFVVIPKKVDEDFVAVLGFNFDIYENMFEIQTKSINASDSSAEQEYTKLLKNEIFEVKKCMEDEYTKRMFLKDFFATLHAHRLSIVKSYEATMMYEIYPRVLEHYPAFKKLPFGDQMNVMRKAYLRGRARSHIAHDIYGFAKATFEQLDAEGLIGELMKIWPRKLVYERRITRRNPEIPSEIWQKNYLVYATYEYTAKTGDKIRESYHPSDLWLILTLL